MPRRLLTRRAAQQVSGVVGPSQCRSVGDSVPRRSVPVVGVAVRVLDPRLVVEPLPLGVVVPRCPFVSGQVAGPDPATHHPIQ
eukprot:16445316-Heterocapsa_arctica.AAC.1